MGDRGHIHIEDTGVYLYTHWKASELPKIVAKALHRGKKRWDDPSYLGRILFQDLVDGDTGLTGYGIQTEPQADAWRVVTVNCENQTVRFAEDRGYSHDEYGGQEFSFEEFVEKFNPKATV